MEEKEKNDITTCKCVITYTSREMVIFISREVTPNNAPNFGFECKKQCGKQPWMDLGGTGIERLLASLGI